MSNYPDHELELEGAGRVAELLLVLQVGNGRGAMVLTGVGAGGASD